jgi:CRP-like cAMP-binding protein
MSSSSFGSPWRGNHLLSLLPSDAYGEIEALLQPVRLEVGQSLHQRGMPLSHVYFPSTAVISAMLPMQEGSAIEIGSIGNEGYCASEMSTGAETSLHDYICQIEGEALCMTAADFAHSLERLPQLRRLAGAYLQGFLTQISQSVTCNSLHNLEARFARWLLFTQDRVMSDRFSLTHDFLAEMLAVQRTSVSLVANTFERAGLIECSKSSMQILERQKLEEASCDCYFKIRDQFRRLLSSQSR